MNGVINLCYLNFFLKDRWDQPLCLLGRLVIRSRWIRLFASSADFPPQMALLLCNCRGLGEELLGLPPNAPYVHYSLLFPSPSNALTIQQTTHSLRKLLRLILPTIMYPISRDIMPHYTKHFCWVWMNSAVDSKTWVIISEVNFGNKNAAWRRP